jgi:membrane associated rhomboid family serine protease
MFPLKTNNVSRHFPVFTLFIIILNVFFFFCELFSNNFSLFIKKYGCTPYEITHFRDLPPYINFPVHFTLLTSIFLHGSWGHLIGNMWFLFIFGKNVEDWLGYRRFILFYLVCGVGASIIYILFSPFSITPLVGASGAIAGILGGYFVLYPRAKVICIVPVFFFIRITALPAFLFLGFWVMWQFFFQVTMGPFSNVAFLAHIGGFFIGLFWIRWLKIKRIGGWR